MSFYKSTCYYEGEKVRQYVVADSKKEAVVLLKQAGFRVKCVDIVPEGVQ